MGIAARCLRLLFTRELFPESDEYDTMAYFWSEAKVVFTPRAEDVSCEENISRNAARFFGLIAN